MALICELKQRVVHTFGVLLAASCSRGYFRNSRENPDFGAFLADSWGKIFYGVLLLSFRASIPPFATLQTECWVNAKTFEYTPMNGTGICLDLQVSTNLMPCPLAFSPLGTGAQPFRIRNRFKQGSNKHRPRRSVHIRSGKPRI